MNKHFDDARYYLKRAGEHAKIGLVEEIRPIEERVRELTGDDDEPEPSRLDSIVDELRALEERAEGEARRAIAAARERIDEYRESRLQKSTR